MRAELSELARRLRGLSALDLAFLLVVCAYVVLLALPWWSTKLLPLMDYPMFLSFVRVFHDYSDPASPFHGFYTRGPAISPGVLPLLLTAALSKLGSIEFAGRVLWTAYALGLPLAAWWLIRTLGASRWNLVLVFPFVFAKWVSSGFFGFATGLPLVLVAYALAMKWLSGTAWRRGAMLAVVMVAIALWHGLLMAQALLGLFVIWACWRARAVRERLVALWPVLPALALFAVWAAGTVSAKTAGHAGPAIAYLTLKETFDSEFFFTRLLMLYPGAELYAKLFAIAAIAMLVASPRESWQQPVSGEWRVRNPIAVIAFLAFISFFALPGYAFGVEIINHRYGWIAAVLAAVAWRWPAQRVVRVVAIATSIAIGAAYMVDVNQRFRHFHRETIGASRLIDTIPDHASLIAPLSNVETSSFENHPNREIQQYATIRKGGLPTTSFAGYGVSFIRYVTTNPRVELYARNFLSHPRLPEFDYVLLQSPSIAIQRSPRLRLVRSDGNWMLFVVCGSKAQPSC